MVYIAMASGFILILMGLYGALTNSNILRMIVSFSVANTGVNIVLVAVGYLNGRMAPILNEDIPLQQAADLMIDPIPQALVLTAIVIGLGVTTLMLAYAYKLFETRGSLDIAKFFGAEMVNAIYIIAIGLGSAFLLGLLKDRWRDLSLLLTITAMTFMAGISASWLLHFSLEANSTAIDFYTAGAKPPFSINLRIGIAESALMLIVSLSSLFSVLYLKQTLLRQGRRAMAVMLIMAMALCGIIMTRDIFNLFVFFELMVIATAGLILLSENDNALAAGFKYLIISQIISILFLIGIIFTYHATGTLNIDGMDENVLMMFKGGSLAFFLLLMAVVLELKPFPANGWGLDVYESAHPAFSALFSSAMAGTAAVFAVDKIVSIAGPEWLNLITIIGIISFVAANLFALPQNNDRRTLGYSSVGQIGLLLVVMGQKDILGDQYLYIMGGILLAHAVAKAGLFWLSGLIDKRDLRDWSVLRQQPMLIFAFITFVAMLIGLPPFPGFYAKWELIHVLAAEGRLWILGLIILGTLIETGYLFRWFGYVIKRDPDNVELSYSILKLSVIFVTVAIAWGLAWLWGELSYYDNLIYLLPVVFALAFLALERFPVWIKNTLAIAGMIYYYLTVYSLMDPLQLIFATIILIGGAIILLASYHVSGRRNGFYPAAMIMYAGLILLVMAKDSFNFFAAWEFLTIGSYFLILRGKHSEPHALSYIIFSMGGAFLILAGFALAANGEMNFSLTDLSQVADSVAPWVFALLAIGFMTKTAAIGVHIWLPGAHAEAETDVSPMVSGILLKAGLFGLFILLMNMGKQTLYGVDLTLVMLWIGALSAFLGNLMAIFQEDAKRTLAYSSIGQMGYALFGLAMMNHIGWIMALMFVINHYIYKSMLFLSVGGIAKRTGTRLMYQMGGLITLMPLSFISILIGIIAVSGVPPLSGFGGRWLFYNAIMSAEYRLPIILIFLAGPLAFLYLFRLIHTIFLGQLKDEHRKIKEAPFWIILPQMIYVVCLMIFALVPGLALKHVDAYIGQFFSGSVLNWDGYTITSSFGYWSPISIMIVVAVIFITLFAWLLFVNRQAQKVKQFNIVYAAERPYRPETTHFAWNFFAPYRKALGFLTQPFVTRFWEAVIDLLHTSADLMRRIYNGNGQTYAIHLLGFVVVVFILSGGI